MAEQQPFRPHLLNIAQELRDMIIGMATTHTVHWDQKGTVARNAGLLLTCKQLYCQSIGPYYANTIFTVRHDPPTQQIPSGSLTWLTAISTEHRDRIREVHCTFHEPRLPREIPRNTSMWEDHAASQQNCGRAFTAIGLRKFTEALRETQGGLKEGVELRNGVVKVWIWRLGEEGEEDVVWMLVRKEDFSLC